MLRWQTTAWNTTGPVNTSFRADPTRIALIHSRTATIVAITAATVFTFNDGTIVQYNGTFPALIMKLEDWGPVIQQSFIITALTTQHPGNTIEIFGTEQLLHASPEEFNRPY